MPDDGSIDRLFPEDEDEEVSTEFDVRFNDQAMFSIAVICIAAVLSVTALHCDNWPSENCRNVCEPRVVKIQDHGRCECQDAPAQ